MNASTRIVCGDHRIKNLKGATLVDIVWVDKKDVFLDEEKNVTRSSGMKTKHITALTKHIGEVGFDPNISIISVEQVGSDFIVVDGSHRFSAIENIDDIVRIRVMVWQFDNDSVRDEFQTRMNVHPPVLPAELKAVSNTIKRLVERGDMEATVEEIRAKVNEMTKGMAIEAKHQIVAMAADDTNAIKQFLSLPNGSASKWLAKNCTPPRMDGFKFDPRRDCLGAVVKDGSEYRIVSRAIKNYLETGMKTEVVVALTSDEGCLKERRQKIVDTINEEFNNQMEFYGVDSVEEYPIEWAGCIPQDLINEDPNTLIEIDEDEIVQDANKPKKTPRTPKR